MLTKINITHSNTDQHSSLLYQVNAQPFDRIADIEKAFRNYKRSSAYLLPLKDIDLFLQFLTDVDHMYQHVDSTSQHSIDLDYRIELIVSPYKWTIEVYDEHDQYADPLIVKHLEIPSIMIPDRPTIFIPRSYKSSTN